MNRNAWLHFQGLCFALIFIFPRLAAAFDIHSKHKQFIESKSERLGYSLLRDSEIDELTKVLTEGGTATDEYLQYSKYFIHGMIPATRSFFLNSQRYEVNWNNYYRRMATSNELQDGDRIDVHCLCYGVRDLGTGKFVGTFKLADANVGDEDVMNLAVFVARNTAQKGVGTEISKHFLDLLRDATDNNPIWTVYPENHASVKIAEKLAFILSGISAEDVGQHLLFRTWWRSPETAGNSNPISINISTP